MLNIVVSLKVLSKFAPPATALETEPVAPRASAAAGAPFEDGREKGERFVCVDFCDKITEALKQNFLSKFALFFFLTANFLV